MRSLTLVATFIACLLLPPAAGAASSWRWPVEGPVITPYRNGDDPYAGGQHRGIDIAAPVGTRVVAAAAGTVTFAGTAGSSGLTVAIRTDDGGFDTAYLHLASAAVHRGDHLTAGDELGTVGTSGRRSAAESHLHFGVREAGSRFAYRDPLDFLPVAPPASAPPRAVPVPIGVPVPVGVPTTAAGAAPAPHAQPLHGLSALAPTASLMATTTASPVTETPAAGPLTETRPAEAIPSQANPASAAATAAPRAAHSGARPYPSHGAHRERHRGAHPTHRPAPHTHSAPRPSTGPPTLAASTPASPAATTTAQRRPKHPDRSTTPDLGWLAACAAMVAVATLLGRPRAASRSLRRAFQPEVSRQ